jgi:alpha-beta hydrolase superfamily lysophospholipase
VKIRLTKLTWRALKAVASSLVGAFVVLVIGIVVYLDSRPDLDAWHLADLDEEFRADAGIETFADYLALEERLFAQLDELVYEETGMETGRETAREGENPIGRYDRGSLSDPARWSPNWNRSFELGREAPEAGVLLLHGMSDSPYSLRSLGQRLHALGAAVIGLRLPGHGTAPSGLVDVHWEDMAAAVRLAVERLHEQAPGRPLFIVGYSNGAALAVHYALATLEDDSRPKVERLVLISPAIGVTKAAALAIWQARIGRLLGLEKLAWNSILPEYDPFKYGSFSVNAGDMVYRLTGEIQSRLDALEGTGSLDRFPPVLAFQSVVDATVSVPALVRGLFDRLPAGGHELVLFDIDRMAGIEAFLRGDPSADIAALLADSGRAFKLSLVTNERTENRSVEVHTEPPGDAPSEWRELGLSWPQDVYSLAHVALPFSGQDPVYGGAGPAKSPGIHLGDLALRGERGVLRIPASEMLRLRWNPFYPYLEWRVAGFLGLVQR